MATDRERKNEIQRAYYQRNRAKINAKRNQVNAGRKEEIRQHNAEYYANNKERIKEHNRQYYQEHKEELKLARKRRYYKSGV